MATTAQTLINQSLRTLGVTDAIETPSSEDSQAALEALNLLLDSYNLDRGKLFTERVLNNTTTVGKSVYTIGTGGDINVSRPVKIISIVIDDERLDEISNTNMLEQIEADGTPYAYTYRPDFPLGVITLYPEPSIAESFDIVTYSELQDDLSLSTVLSYPPGYLRFLKNALAIEMAPEFGKTISPELSKNYIDSKVNVERINVPTPVSRIPRVDSTYRRYNIYNDR